MIGALRSGVQMRRIGFAMLLAVVVVSAPMGALAQEDPYGADPLGLIAHLDQVRAYSIGRDVIEVFVCDVPDGNVGVDLETATAAINDSLQPYFSWLSGGVYQPVFVPGGVVIASAPSGWPGTLALQPECEDLAASASAGTAAGALVIVDADYSGGYATAGAICEPVTDCSRRFPVNRRVMVVGAATVVATVDYPSARLSTIAHELGHAIDFPHSFGGLTLFANGTVYEYDNPNDIMSGGSLTTLEVGTLAVNRYAAGWLIPGIAFHRGGDETYTVETIAGAGTQMLVLPTDTPGLFTVLGARQRDSYDAGVGATGIEVYRVDQRSSACLSASDSCWGADRRTAQVPAIDDPDGLAHVFAVGEQFTIDGATVSVDAASAMGWTVRVVGATVSERFVDDDASVHETSIEALADLGVTRGCNPPTIDRFCPTTPVTRAEMAVFLTRALDDAVAPSAGVGVFGDVAENVWYSDAIARMYELGITTGYTDGTYRPNAPVSRGEMAVFLDRAFDTIIRTSPDIVFPDVAPGAFFAASTQALYDSNVTLGCSSEPLAYCPFDQVTRGQMASFLVRAIVGPVG